MKVSCGTLLYRTTGDNVEVLLVHPSGEYNAKAPYSIPKGECEKGEGKEEAARRETEEEVGVKPPEHLESLGEVVYRRGKRVLCFAGEAPVHARPKCASWEIDRAEFLPLEVAERKLMSAQLPFLRRLKKKLEKQHAHV